eukprot:TRINITY_DN20093_c0_g1_i1.p1 TRINITY_DN20093_c0_g1~~TRINITY_DN20093_c0_g1_i1.p1  ORF type:complete len:764 (-),score=58.63 TRINITY_DN20093_c0_g1_i1:78-2369(-)
MLIPIWNSVVVEHTPAQFHALYKWLPLWLVCVLEKNVGAWLKSLANCIVGLTAVILFVFAINSVMMGGAGKASKDPLVQKASPMRYSAAFAISYFLLVAYYFFTWNRPNFSRALGVATLTGLFMSFINPDFEGATFEGVLRDIQGNINWSGAVFCNVYLFLAAYACSLLCMIVVVLASFVVDIRSCSAPTAAANELADLKLRFETLVDPCSMIALSGSQLHDMDSIEMTVATMSKQVELTKACADDAVATALSQSQKSAVRKLYCSIELFGNLQAALVVMLHVRGDTASENDVTAFNEFFQRFLGSFGSALHTITQQSWFFGSDEDVEPLKKECVSYVTDASNLIDVFLQSRREASAEGGLRSSAEVAIILFGCIEHINTTLLELPQPFEGEARFPPAIGIDAAFYPIAVPNFLAWLAGMIWGVYARKYNTTCAITVAWLFGDAEINYVRTFKEIVGTVVGTIVGGLPGMLLRAFPTSNVTIQTFTVCCIMSTYYASFTYLWYKDHLDWRITFLLFTCFGSAEMLADLSNVSENLGDGYEASQYQMMIDLLAGCMFLLGCHAFVRPLFFNDPVDAASEKVAVTLTCLSRCLKIIEGKEMVDDDATKLSAIERTIGEFTISLSEARDAIGYADSLKPFHWKGHIAQKVVDACVAIEKDMLLVMYVMNAFPAQDTCGMLAVSLPSDLSVRVDELSDLAKAVLSQGSTDGSGRASKQFTPKTMSLKANASVHEEISHHVLELVMSRISDNLAGIESCLSVQDIISK